MSNYDLDDDVEHDTEIDDIDAAAEEAEVAKHFITAKQGERDRIEQLTREFIARGGKINEIAGGQAVGDVPFGEYVRMWKVE